MNNNQFKAEILTISDEVKTKVNGKQYLVCTVKFLDGSLKGETYFAQRTLGEKKSPIRVGQEIVAIASVVDNRPYFEVSTGTTVSDSSVILAALEL